MSLFADGGDFFLVEIFPYNFPAPLLVVCAASELERQEKKSHTDWIEWRGNDLVRESKEQKKEVEENEEMKTKKSHHIEFH